VTGIPASAHDEAGSEGTQGSDGWMIWHGPGRGYVALENDLPTIADALEVLWYLRAQRPGPLHDHGG
jgi:hypothetical protein